MRNLRNIGLGVFVLILSVGCKSPQSMLSQGIAQGISGQILWYEGDLMPGIDKEPAEGKPIQREIYIYKATTIGQTEAHEGIFYSNINTELVLTTSSDEDGKFIVALAPGTYSVFIKEPQGLFANRIDQGGVINPVTVSQNELVSLIIRVDYRAAY